ncbi:hypothetical protein LNTAR_09524 [Lentisphaera araneosa HTCC2155]|jgi:hypothetical protein|uniref:Uncharacterized protein n=1 Tax=Lentisphaera araneosa HTCC2155 TaxID=313628 RepID=A6DIE6_9BACT|nr:hypothetical protein LNTAR_09524 [Lentisphaera araneosa HTCC2155]
MSLALGFSPEGGVIKFPVVEDGEYVCDNMYALIEDE